MKIFSGLLQIKIIGLKNARSSTARIPTRRHGDSANPPFWI